MPTFTCSTEKLQEMCRDVQRAKLRTVNALAIKMIAAYGGAEMLPQGFSISGKAWLEAEERIASAVDAVDLFETENACDDYEARARKYFSYWWNTLETSQCVQMEATNDRP